MLSRLSRIGLYVIFLFTPLILSFFLRPRSENILLEISVSLALVGFMTLSAQIFLVGRFKWIEKVFGLDILIRYHRKIAVFAITLIILHPVLLAAGSGKWKLLWSFDVPLLIWLGKITLALLILNGVVSYYQRQFQLKFETWRILHDILGPLIIGMAFFHSFFIGEDLTLTPLKTIWIVILILDLTLFGYHRFFRPWIKTNHKYMVTEVNQVTPKVWTIKFIPPKEEKISSFLPGQFHFLTFHRKPGLPEEEHHWTISSSPTEPYLSSTIKELGDFTATIGETKSGDTVAVDGAYGRFSYLLHPEEKELVFLIGGIGITPVRSMIKHLHDTGNSMPVALLYANNDENGITFKDEFEAIAASGFPKLKVVHVLSKPGKEWPGETGFIDQAKLEKYCGHDFQGKGFYLCGPQSFLDSLLHILLNMGANANQIHMELFSFLG